MRWFVFPKNEHTNSYPVVQAKTLKVATARLSRWNKQKENKPESLEALNNGIGYNTMTEAWAKYTNITVVAHDN